MFEVKTYEEIMERMLSRVPSTLDKREGAIIWDALAPAAKELEDMYFTLKMIIDESFADTASRKYLIRRAKERGIAPYPANNSILKGEFNKKIILGSRFNLDDLNYKAIKFIEENNNLYYYELECENKGRVGNSRLGNLIPIDYIDGLTLARITELLIPGEDEESTEHFRKRYFETFNMKAYGGNIADYKMKVHEIDGVGAVKVTPIWNGGGTVKLTIIDSDYNKASPSLINKVQEIIDPTQNGIGLGVAPIGHIVTVVGTDNLVINITTELTFEPDYNLGLVRLSIEKAIQDYLLELRKNWSLKDELVSNNLIVRISRIEAKILDVDGILDIQKTRINGSDNNLQLEHNQIPIFGNIQVRTVGSDE